MLILQNTHLITEQLANMMKCCMFQAEDIHFLSREDTLIDLRHNKISEINIFSAKRVFSFNLETNIWNVLKRKISIHGNPVNCTCEQFSFLEHDYDSSDQILAQITLTTENREFESCNKDHILGR